MKKYKVVIEEHVTEEFLIEAENMEEAMELAEKKYYDGEFVLEPGNVINRLMEVESLDDGYFTEWIEF